MRGQEGEPTEGTVLQHHCLSLVTKGADEMRKRGVSPWNPWLFRIVFHWKMTSKLRQPVTMAEVSCHRGIPLLTSPGWALSCRDVPQPRLVELVGGEGDPAGGALLNPPCLRPKIGRARCSAGKPSWCSKWWEQDLCSFFWHDTLTPCGPMRLNKKIDEYLRIFDLIVKFKEKKKTCHEKMKVK